MILGKNIQIVYRALREKYFSHTDGRPVFVGTIREGIQEKYNLRMSEEMIKSLLEELQSLSHISCYYDRRDGLISAIVV